MADHAQHAKDTTAQKADETKQFGQQKAGEAQHNAQVCAY